MDPVTHAALGGTIGLAGFRGRLGRRAMVVGALVGMAPDLDVLAGWMGGPLAEWLYHRGLTHSVLFAITAGPLLGWALWRLLRRGEGVGPWIGLATAALITHPLIDVITHYGTQLLAPLSQHRFGLPAMPIIDPVFTLILLAALLAGAVAKRRQRLGSAAGWTALVAAYAYVLFAWSLNDQIEAEARRQLAAAGIAATEVRAYPTILQPYYRRIVARHDDRVLVGFHSVLAPRPIDWAEARADDGVAVEAVAATSEARVLSWFADGHVLWQVMPNPGGSEVEARDLRYGFPEPGSQFGIWGIRAAVAADGRPTAPPEVFKSRLSLNGERLARLWRLVFG